MAARRLTFRAPAILSVLASLVLALAASCGDDATAPEENAPFTGTVRVLDNRFSPRDVTIAVGDSVTWSWEGAGSHSVTQGTTDDPSEDPGRLFDSGIQSSGTFGFRFTSAGTVPYFCRPHLSAGMTGTVTVQ